MVQFSISVLDLSFAALSDQTRRGVLQQLAGGETSITALAKQFSMTLTGMAKHVLVLEKAGLVVTEKIGRTRTCRLGSRNLADEAAWIDRYRQLWDARFKVLDILIEELQSEDEQHG